MDILSHSEIAPEKLGALLDLCFGPARQKRTAALLRADAERIEDASFVAIDGDELIGSVEVWRLELRMPNRTKPIALLGPLVSHPQRRGEKIGSMLMDLALAELDKQKLAVMLIGDKPYYERWGFSDRFTGKWQLPGPVDRERLLLRARDGHNYAGPAVLGAPPRQKNGVPPVATERAA